MSVPRRFRQLGDFHLYYSGKRRAPVLTIVIGGNHEASNYMSELYHGGWLAPNIYYLGAVGVIRCGPLRICGLSGIFERSDYRKPRYECLPYDRKEVRSIYHVRESDTFKLLQIRSPVDIGLSHDWPRRIDYFGDCEKLFTIRPNFFESAKLDRLGSEPAEQVLNHLRPHYWFSGHMHIKYEATVHHQETTSKNFFEKLSVPEKIQKQLPKSVSTQTTSPKHRTTITNTSTKFIALDKPGPGLDFLQLLEIESAWGIDDPTTAAYLSKTPIGKFGLHYDEEWLSILRSTQTTTDSDTAAFGINALSPDNLAEDSISEALEWVRQNITDKGFLRVPENFEAHAPAYDGVASIDTDEQPPEYSSSQTQAFCKMLGIRNMFTDEGTSCEGDGIVSFE